MACLEHRCTRCEWEDSSNSPVKQCPLCGCYEIATVHDEQHDDHSEDVPDDFRVDDFDDEA